MDLNRTYFEHQLATMQASSALCHDSRARHQADADGIGRRIRRFQQAIGAAAAESWDLSGTAPA